MDSFDAIIIGAGSAGLTLMHGFVGLGKRVAIIEKEHIGGDCTNVGCVPSKAFLHWGKVAPLDWLAYDYMKERRQFFRDHETPEYIRKSGAEYIAGSATIAGPNEVQVGKRIICAKRIYIATGATPVRVELPGVPADTVLTYHEIFELQKPIKHLVILGGGFIAYELAIAFAQSGVKVTILVRGKRMLADLEPRAYNFAKEALEKVGVTVHTSVLDIRGKSDTITFNNGEHSIPYDRVLVAYGRKPNIEWLWLENIGVTVHEKGILTDAYGVTSTANIFAVGDVVAHFPQFTHAANDAARTMVRNRAFPLWRKKIRTENFPRVLYGTPEIASIGLSASEAREKYGDACYVAEARENDRMQIETQSGYAQIIALPLTGRIVGATIVSQHAGELIGIISLAIETRTSVFALARTVFSYPTESDILKRIASQMSIEILKTIPVDVFKLLKRNRLKIFAATLWMTILASFFAYKSISGKTDFILATELYGFFTSGMGGIIYICVYALRPIVLFPATLLTILSWVLFWPAWGFFYTMIGENLSAQTAYCIGRFFGKPAEIAPLKRERSGIRAFITILLSRLTFLPFDLVNYTAGFLKTPWISYTLATIIGIIPWALTFILVGASIENFETFDVKAIRLNKNLILTSAALFVLSLFLAYGLRRWSKR